MDWFMSLYASQPFWLWLAIGLILLAVESMFSTEWLLWPAVAAGVVAIISAILPTGFIVELGLFALITVVLTLISRKLVKRVNPDDLPDINDVGLRLVGQKARVVEAFVNGQGRVFISGSEWPADSDGLSPLVGEAVIVDAVNGQRLRVRQG